MAVNVAEMVAMTAFADHRAECAVIAFDRRKAGRPQWDERIDVSDVFHDDDIDFEAKRDAIVATLKASRWYRRSDEFDTIREIVEELGEVEDVDEFDYVWDAVYDEADLGEWRVWITT